MESLPTDVTSSLTTKCLILSLFHAVVPLRNPYFFSFSTRSFGLTKFRSISVCVAVMTQASTLEPEPRSLKIPASMAERTSARASSRYEGLG